MHEYAVTESIIKTAVEAADNAGASAITEIRLVIGDLSTIIDESVQLYFDIISKDTKAEKARLVFNRVPAQFKCRDCGEVYNKPVKGFDCPRCGGQGMPTGVGREFYIDSIEVE
jgi:hydrogenase nickel incorporation protein HypA/HybF